VKRTREIFRVAEKVKKGFRRISREVVRDIRNMERIQSLAKALNQRDTNCGGAASLTDAIEVLIGKALDLHRAELKDCLLAAKTGKLR
jgi:hypothetical protein